MLSGLLRGSGPLKCRVVYEGGGSKCRWTRRIQAVHIRKCRGGFRPAGLL